MASPKIVTCTEAARIQSGNNNIPSHDAVNRLLHRLKPSSSALIKEAVQFIKLKKGVLVLDDSTLDKLYAQNIELVCHHSCVLFDSWYSGLDNLKVIRKYGWHWMTRLKSNRHTL